MFDTFMLFELMYFILFDQWERVGQTLMIPPSGAVGVVLIGVVLMGVALIRVTLIGIAGQTMWSYFRFTSTLWQLRHLVSKRSR